VHDDGSSTTWLTPFFHRTTQPDGSTRDYHVGPFFRGPRHWVLFPLAYSVGEEGKKHQGILPPLFVRGPGYVGSPLMFTGWWRDKNDDDWFWLTPLFHRTWDAGGTARHTHALTWFKGEDYEVLFPFGYRFGKRGKRHFGILPPLYHQGPSYKVAPPLLSGWYKTSDGSHETWITPLFHHSRNPDGSLKQMHALLFGRSKNAVVFFPLYWKWKDALGRTRRVIPWLYHAASGGAGAKEIDVLWPLFTYRRGAKLDTSLRTRLRLSTYQRGEDGFEFHFLGAFPYARRRGGSSLSFFPLVWLKRRPRAGVPAEIYLGPFGSLAWREVDYTRRRYRWRVLYLPIGRWKHFESPREAR
jgi:hypothetical protein